MKHIIHIILIALACAIFGLSACSANLSVENPEEAGAPAAPATEKVLDQTSDMSETAPCNPAALTAIREVLLNQREFMTGFLKEDADYYAALESPPMTLGSESITLQKYLDDWTALNQDNGVVFRFFAFALCDLDRDGTPEVILDIAAGDNDYGRFILRYEDGTVYGYDLPYRGFMGPKTDGTFQFSNSAFDNGIAAIIFDQEFYAYDNITYSRSEYDENDNMLERYYVDGAEATEDAFSAALRQQEQKPDVEWYDFTEETIEAVFSALLP